MAQWPAGVAVVAFRDGGRVVATTVSAFTSLSVEPPAVLIALGPNATVRPFLQPGAGFGVSVLSEEQRRLASVFADPFPVGPHPFTPDGVPVIADALVTLDCRVSELHAGADHVIIAAAVLDLSARGGRPLIRFQRAYRRLAD